MHVDKREREKERLRYEYVYVHMYKLKTYVYTYIYIYVCVECRVEILVPEFCCARLTEIDLTGSGGLDSDCSPKMSSTRWPGDPAKHDIAR